MLRKWSGVLVLMLWTSVAMAASTSAEIRKQVEASMLLQGTIDIDVQGQVVGHHLAQASSLPPALLDYVDRRIRAWHFEPVLVDGKPVHARSPMQLRLVTKKDGENYLLRIAGANFGTTAGAEDEVPRIKDKLGPPHYPELAAHSGVGGTVYMVLRVGRDGSVVEAIAEQVNLRSVGTEREMRMYRRLLADASIEATRRWTFTFPTRGEDADAPFVSVRVPVDFVTPNLPEAKPGQWQAYVPGPRQGIPWRTWDDAAESPDALAAGGVYPDRPRGPKLIGGLDG